MTHQRGSLENCVISSSSRNREAGFTKQSPITGDEIVGPGGIDLAPRFLIADVLRALSSVPSIFRDFPVSAKAGAGVD
jgi:hypothetical protein